MAGLLVSGTQYSFPPIMLQTPGAQGTCLRELSGPAASCVTVLGHSGSFLKEKIIPSAGVA